MKWDTGSSWRGPSLHDFQLVYPMYFHDVAHTLQDSPALSLFLTLGSDLRRRLVSGFCICKAFPLHPAHHPKGPADVACICQICYVYSSNLPSVFVKVIQCISRLVSGFCIWKSFPLLHSSQWVGRSNDASVARLCRHDSGHSTPVWWNTEDNVCLFFFALLIRSEESQEDQFPGVAEGQRCRAYKSERNSLFSIRQKNTIKD